MTTRPTAQTSAAIDDIQRDLGDLKEIVAMLAELTAAQRNSVPPAEPDCPPKELTPEQRDGARTAFKYKFLSALMTGVDATTLAFAVVRYGNGVDIGLRPVLASNGTAPTGSYLSGAGQTAGGQRVPFLLAITDGVVKADQLRAATVNIDVTRPFEPFTLWDKKDGAIIASAPEIGSLPTVTVIRDDVGLAVQRCGVAGGDRLAGVGYAADDKPAEFEVALTGDKVSRTTLETKGVLLIKAFDKFVLRQGANGSVVAIAQGLPAVGTTH